MSQLRRYEVLVPLVLNDGKPAPESLVAEAFMELRERFNSASWETQVVRGVWEHGGAVYQDNFTRFFVDVPDLPEHREGFKEKLKRDFNQLDIWITSHPIDVI